MYSYVYETEIGSLIISEENGEITEVHFGRLSKYDTIIKETDIIKETHKQLEEYFEKKRKQFNLPLNPKGTDFQVSVWKELQKIPYGETKSYQKIAQNIENPKAVRAVGMANHVNPIAIIIPCHRVIGKDGKLVGYAGGMDIKSKLLELEKTI